MSCRHPFIAMTAALGLLVHAASYAAVAPLAPQPAVPEPGKAAEQAAPEEPSGPMCVVAGTVYCSEYGSRFRETLMLVLVDEHGRYVSSISDTNGSFALLAPCGGSFALYVEFRDKSLSLGSLELPESDEGAAFTLEIRHTGSYLELVRDVRNGIEEDDMTYRLEPVGE